MTKRGFFKSTTRVNEEGEMGLGFPYKDYEYG